MLRSNLAAHEVCSRQQVLCTETAALPGSGKEVAGLPYFARLLIVCLLTDRNRRSLCRVQNKGINAPDKGRTRKLRVAGMQGRMSHLGTASGLP